jgi:hypothetical protein
VRVHSDCSVPQRIFGDVRRRAVHFTPGCLSRPARPPQPRPTPRVRLCTE